MKHWLRGGLYGITAGLFIFLIGILINTFGIVSFDESSSKGFLIILKISIILFSYPFRFFKESLIMQLSFWSLQTFLIGSFLGWLTGLRNNK